MRTLILDLHGVLVDSKKVKENYEIFLKKLYSDFNINEKKAIEYHKNGLTFFLNSINVIKSKNLIDEKFLEEMQVIDNEWDDLMRKPVLNWKNKSKLLEIESRQIELKSGMIRNVFYPDAINFLKYWLKKMQSHFKIVIASNSHSSHIKGVISGFDENLVSKVKIYGWDKTKCLKSHPNYFLRLKEIINSDLKKNLPLIMIGNSNDEIIGSSNEKMLPILINRDANISNFAFKKAEMVFNSLDGVWYFIRNLN